MYIKNILKLIIVSSSKYGKATRKFVIKINLDLIKLLLDKKI